MPLNRATRRLAPHGRTAAAPPSRHRPGNAYVREDRILPRLPAVHLLLTGPGPPSGSSALRTRA